MAILPQMTLVYLLVEVIVSAVFVVFEQISVFSLPIAWFMLMHIVILAVFSIRIIIIYTGGAPIWRIDDRVHESTFDWKLLILDVDALTVRSPEVKPVLEALRYSDPMTNSKLTEYDVSIRNSVAALECAVDEGDSTRVDELIIMLQRQIRDRNNRVKLLK